MTAEEGVFKNTLHEGLRGWQVSMLGGCDTLISQHGRVVDCVVGRVLAVQSDQMGRGFG
jgi:hypothetical protein